MLVNNDKMKFFPLIKMMEEPQRRDKEIEIFDLLVQYQITTSPKPRA